MTALMAIAVAASKTWQQQLSGLSLYGEVLQTD